MPPRRVDLPTADILYRSKPRILNPGEGLLTTLNKVFILGRADFRIAGQATCC